MKRDLDKQERLRLEAMIDATSIGAVLEALSEIMGEKAQHIRESWQDSTTARLYDTAAGALGLLAVDSDITVLE